MSSLSGRKALVTGSTEGIGLGIARALLEAGAEVILHGPFASSGDAALTALRSEGHDPLFHAADFSVPGAATTLIETAGPLDILVSNVSIQARLPFGRIPRAEAVRHVEVNFLSVIDLLQAAVPAMAARGWGRVVTIGSVQEERPHPEMMVYAALKSAQVSLVRNLARQVGASGVTVNNVAPGVVLTARNTEALSDPAYAAQVLERVPVGRFGEPQDVAGAVVFLCSDAAGFITGATLACDGGQSL